MQTSLYFFRLICAQQCIILLSFTTCVTQHTYIAAAEHKAIDYSNYPARLEYKHQQNLMLLLPKKDLLKRLKIHIVQCEAKLTQLHEKLKVIERTVEQTAKSKLIGPMHALHLEPEKRKLTNAIRFMACKLAYAYDLQRTLFLMHVVTEQARVATDRTAKQPNSKQKMHTAPGMLTLHLMLTNKIIPHNSIEQIPLLSVEEQRSARCELLFETECQRLLANPQRRTKLHAHIKVLEIKTNELLKECVKYEHKMHQERLALITAFGPEGFITAMRKQFGYTYHYCNSIVEGIEKQLRTTAHRLAYAHKLQSTVFIRQIPTLPPNFQKAVQFARVRYLP